MGAACAESRIDSVWRDPPHYAFVCAEPAALPGVGCDLHAILADYAMDSLPVHLDALLSKFAPYPAIAIILMQFPDLLDLLQQLFVRVFSFKTLLPIHVCRLWKANYRENVL